MPKRHDAITQETADFVSRFGQRGEAFSRS